MVFKRRLRRPTERDHAPSLGTARSQPALEGLSASLSSCLPYRSKLMQSQLKCEKRFSSHFLEGSRVAGAVRFRRLDKTRLWPPSSCLTPFPKDMQIAASPCPSTPLKKNRDFAFHVGTHLKPSQAPRNPPPPGNLLLFRLSTPLPWKASLPLLKARKDSTTIKRSFAVTMIRFLWQVKASFGNRCGTCCATPIIYLANTQQGLAELEHLACPQLPATLRQGIPFSRTNCGKA